MSSELLALRPIAHLSVRRLLRVRRGQPSWVPGFPQHKPPRLASNRLALGGDPTADNCPSRCLPGCTLTRFQSPLRGAAWFVPRAQVPVLRPGLGPWRGQRERGPRCDPRSLFRSTLGPGPPSHTWTLPSTSASRLPAFPCPIGVPRAQSFPALSRGRAGIKVPPVPGSRQSLCNQSPTLSRCICRNGGQGGERPVDGHTSRSRGPRRVPGLFRVPAPRKVASGGRRGSPHLDTGVQAEEGGRLQARVASPLSSKSHTQRLTAASMSACTDGPPMK